MDNDIGSRIDELIKALKIKKVRFAEQIKVDQAYVTQLTKGKRNPSNRLINSICREFNVSEVWLRTGEGEMFDQQSDRDEIADAVERLMTGQSADFKRRLVNALSTLKDEHWLILEEKLKEIVAEQEPEPASSDNDIEQDVEDYRRRRTLEKNPEEKSSPLSEDGSETA